jgi:hypothetical protein
MNQTSEFPSKLLYLSRADVEQVALDMHTTIELLEAAFREKGEGRVEMLPGDPHPARCLHPRHAGLHPAIGRD